MSGPDTDAVILTWDAPLCQADNPADIPGIRPDEFGADVFLRERARNMV